MCKINIARQFEIGNFENALGVKLGLGNANYQNHDREHGEEDRLKELKWE